MPNIKDLNKKMIEEIVGGDALSLLKILDSRKLSTIIPLKMPNTMWDCRGPNSALQAADCVAYGACGGGGGHCIG